MTCSKLYATKIKYSKSSQSQRTKGEIKTSFNFSVILCIYVSKNGEKQKITVYRYLLFFAIFIAVYSHILVPTLIEVADAVHTHT